MAVNSLLIDRRRLVFAKGIPTGTLVGLSRRKPPTFAHRRILFLHKRTHSVCFCLSKQVPV